MKVPLPELIALCGAVRDDAATPEQIARLEVILTSDPDARRFYRRFTQIGALLERYEQPPLAALETPLSPPSRQRGWRFGRGRPWFALAACLALLAAVYFGGRRGEVPVERGFPIRAAVATVQDVYDATLISPTGAPTPLSGGHRLGPGEVVATGHNGGAVLRFRDEETLFVLGTDTRVWLAFEPSAKIVHLAFGQVSCDVAKQRDGMRWRIVTTDGDATVLGTRLAVSVGGSGTRVAVTAGLVRVTSRDSRESVETPAGYATELTPTTAIRSKLPPTASTRLASFTLVHADTNAPLPGFERLADGAVLDLASLPTRRLNIRANCEPLIVGAVRFQLTGVDPGGQPLRLELPVTNGFPNSIEAFYPHLLAGDVSFEDQPLPSHSNPWTPPVGRYTLVATPYAGKKASGARGESLVVHFEVVDGAAPK